MIIWHFLEQHWTDLILGIVGFFALTVKFLPARFAGLLDEYYDLNQKKMVKQGPSSLLEAITTAVYFTLNKALFITAGLRGFTTVIMFVIIGAALVFNRNISTGIIIVAAVGILALYAEQLITQAKSFSIWKIFTYVRKDDQ